MLTSIDVRIAIAAAVLTAAASLSYAAPPARATTLVDIPFGAGYPPGEIVASLAEESNAIWLGTSRGLYRLPKRIEAGSEATLVAFAGREIRNLVIHDGALYVLKATAEAVGGPSTDRGLLRTVDGGATFEPLDDGLEECLGGYCSYLSPSEAAFDGDTLFSNAGGNFLARSGSGPWVALVGSLQQQACYDPSFAVNGTSVLIGGECPLDTAYVRRARLREGMLEWEQPPADAITPSLGNRNVQFIRFLGEGSTVIAGIEGAILRSSDGGASFGFALYYALDDPRGYPYVTELLDPSAGDGELLAGGFDKATMAPYLAWSRDEGRTWHDVSRAVTSAHPGFDVLAFLHEDASGRLLAGLLDVETSTIRIVELTSAPPRRRPARR